MKSTNIKDTLFEHFAGRSTALQRTMIADWLREPANQTQYVAWLDEWEQQHLQYLADEDTAFQNLNNRIDTWEDAQHHVTETQQPTIIRPLFAQPRWLVAAAVLLCLLGGLYASRTYWLYQTIETAYGETRPLTLSDGSHVTLNAHSTLRVPRFGFGQKSRTVWLTGEAAFTVQHTATNQRFVVHTNRGVDVVVLGTEFNVSDRPGGTKVVLSKGAIQLNYTGKTRAVRQLRLKPGDAVSVDPSGQLRQSHTTQPEISTVWREHRFVFNHTTVREIAELLRDTYNLRVVLKNKELATRTVTGSFEARNADEFLQVVAELLEINYKQKDNTVTFFE
ncbi:FecR domain-containing protein [Spirosoma sp. BT702]|uniref:FecR domain-containing protein n=1 Tax=Spirosoma profusum TaxID=2771354 RepID=A0A926XX29_9BACT|nr:FecR domain-containing protein [Spirosoma profusum]MBD2702262.1 FecR domain-containing protein [Spirosoma profusum]